MIRVLMILMTVLVSVVLSAYVGHAAGEKQIPAAIREVKDEISGMVYIQDEKTGLCFGVAARHYVVGFRGPLSISMVEIACDRVKEYIDKCPENAGRGWCK